jgi:nucleoside 2-deoxyribosyltransferase
MLVAEARETGPQGYEYLLRENHECIMQLNGISLDDSVSDYVVFPGGFDLGGVLSLIKGSRSSVHVDANFEASLIEPLLPLSRPVDTLILSTSSSLFLDHYQGKHQAIVSDVTSVAHQLLLKENRGGSRLFRGEEVIPAYAQPRKVVHSIGVGDCFDVVYVALRRQHGDRAALAYASCIAAEYACTTYPDLFAERAQQWLSVPPDEIADLGGTLMPWEARRQVHIYVAAPDFQDVDCRPIDAVANALTYHNFVPRRPVREAGEAEPDADENRRQSLCEADLRILGECKILLAVLLYDDPGTLIEIGIAYSRDMPVIVYDPYKRARNLMLTQVPVMVSSDLDEVVTCVFSVAAQLRS